MNYKKTIICLANSQKTSGRCIAGRELTDGVLGPWIRPVSKRETREISEEDRRYEEGSRPQVLDIIEIPMLEHSPNLFHTEDHLIDDSFHWKKVGEASWEMVEGLVETHEGPLWINGSSTYHGRNDKIPEPEAACLTSSLHLIRPNNLAIVVHRESGYQGRPSKMKVRAHFEYSENNYRLTVTDPVIKQGYIGRGEGEYPLDRALICVSLSELWNEYSFKLVACVITRERVA